MNLQVIQFQYGLDFLRLPNPDLKKLSKMSLDGSSSSQQNSVPFRIEFLNIIISKTNCTLVGITLDRIIGSSDPEVLEDQVSDLSSSKEAVLFSGFSVPPY